MSLLSLRNISKKYGSVVVVPDLDLDIEEGEFAVLVGPSGCGKTTLLRMIAGLEDISGGDLLIDGKRANDLHPRERGVSMVFQSYALYPHMSVRENIGFGLKLEKRPKQEIDRIVDEVVDTLQLSDYGDRRPSALSGGQRQRVAIGRALARKPRFILFDEPLSNLDAKLRVTMRAELQEFHKRHGITTIYVTHDQVEAMTMADRIAVMNAGRVLQHEDPLSVYKSPVNRFVAEFIGSPQMNMLDVVSAGEDGLVLEGGITLRKPDGFTRDIKACSSVGIRPEHVQVVQSGKGIADVTVDVTEHMGDDVFTRLTLGDKKKITAKSRELDAPAFAERADVSFDWPSLHFFNAAGDALQETAA